MSFRNLSDLNELLVALSELNRINSDAERVAWVGRNYKHALRVSKSLFARLLKVFRQSVWLFVYCYTLVLIPYLLFNLSFLSIACE